MASDDVIVLNQPGITRRVRTSGRVQFTVEIKSEPLIHTFDPKTLGKVVAEAMAETLRQKILAITQKASAATLEWRKSAERGLSNHAETKELRKTKHAKAEIAAGRGHLLGNRGGWAHARYGGGRTGAMPPNQSDRMFNDSGRMAKSIAAVARDDSWTVVMAANRLDPATANGGELGVHRIFRKLVELVPAFGDTKKLFEEKGVQGAVQQSLQMMIVKAKETRDQLSEARARAALNLAKQIFAGVRSLAM